jgi:DNA mismatch repair ATPase MutS
MAAVLEFCCMQMAGLPTSVVQRAAVVARQLKVRLGVQQQQQQQQHSAQEQANALPLLEVTQQVCKVLRAAQQDAAQLSELSQLQASACHLLAAPQQG